jgi:hypothetical protein
MTLLVEMGWGGLVQAPATITWTDITQYVDGIVNGVTVSRGASDELSETQPGTATLRLDNADGRFTPGNASSPYYPFVRRNAPIRVSVAVMPTVTGSAPFPLAMLGDDFDDSRINTTLWSGTFGTVSEVGGRARISAIAGTTSGFLSSRQWRLQGSSTTVRLATVPSGGTNPRTGFMVNAVTAGTRIGFLYSAAGVLACRSDVGFSDGAAVTLTYSPIDHLWLRIREASGTVYWETSPDGYTWTVRRSLATPAWVGTDQVALQIDAARDAGTTDFAEYDLVGATVKPRFYGMVNEFPVDWEGLNSTVTISCTDLFKRLNRLPALRSMAIEEVIASGALVLYPLTEPADSISVGDVSGTGAGSLTIQQAGSGGTLTMAAAPGPAGSGDSVPTFTPVSATVGKWLSGDMGETVLQQLTTGWPVYEVWFQTTTPGRVILGLTSANLQYVHVLSLSAAGALQFEWTDSGSSTLTLAPGFGPSGLADGKWHHFLYDQLAGDAYLDGVSVGSVSVPFVWDKRILHVGGYRGTRLWSGQIGYVAVYAVNSPISASIAQHYGAGTGYDGETADLRIQRLARYGGVSSVTIAGSTHDPIASQGPGGSQVVARMREVESTESGKLFARRDALGLAYQSRDLRYNPTSAGEAFTISYADLEPGTSFADDDQKMVNQVDASRPGGATQRVTAPSSILAFGEYPKPLDILKTSDNSVLDAAYWLVSRYANPGPELREAAIEAYSLSSFLAVLDADISSYFTIFNLPAQAPTSSLRVTVEGYTETIKERSHVIQFHTSATVNDSVWVLDDSTYSVLDSTTRLAY